MSEKSEAKRDGAKLQKNSGRGEYQKGDATLNGFCVDYKEYAESFSVSRKVWAKCNTDAWKMGLRPALKLVLGKENKVRLWVIDDQTMHDLLDKEAELERLQNLEDERYTE